MPSLCRASNDCGRFRSLIRGGEGDLEAVYLVRGSVLSLSSSNHTNQIDEMNQRDQMHQFPATRREMVECKAWHCSFPALS